MTIASRHTVRRDAFRFARPALLWGQVLLFTDRIELRGWGLRGRYRRAIALRDVEHVDVRAADEVSLWCAGGETLHLRLRGAVGWKRSLLDRQALQGGTPTEGTRGA